MAGVENPILCNEELPHLLGIMESQEAHLVGVAHCIVHQEHTPSKLSTLLSASIPIISTANIPENMLDSPTAIVQVLMPAPILTTPIEMLDVPAMKLSTSKSESSADIPQNVHSIAASQDISVSNITVVPSNETMSSTTLLMPTTFSTSTLSIVNLSTPTRIPAEPYQVPRPMLIVGNVSIDAAVASQHLSIVEGPPELLPDNISK